MGGVPDPADELLAIYMLCADPAVPAERARCWQGQSWFGKGSRPGRKRLRDMRLTRKQHPMAILVRQNRYRIRVNQGLDKASVLLRSSGARLSRRWQATFGEVADYLAAQMLPPGIPAPKSKFFANVRGTSFGHHRGIQHSNRAFQVFQV